MSDGLVTGVILVPVAVCGAVWLWTGLASGLFGRGWVSLSPARLPGVLSQLPAHLAAPAHAYPRAVRAELPGRSGFVLALALLAGAVAVAVCLLARTGRRVVRPNAGARWARPRDLRVLRGSRDTSPRLTLGRLGGRPIQMEARHALVAFGPPQSGKSAGLAVPALLEWRGPAVASSIKTDLLEATIARRRRLGRVFVFDPFALSGTPSDTWSPLPRCRTWDGALESAWRLAGAAEVDSRGVEGGDFWAVAAEQRLAPLLFAAARADLGMDAVVRWVYGQGGRELDETIARLTGEASTVAAADDVHAAYDALRAFEAQADRTRTSIEATAQGLLRAYRFRRVLRASSSCQINADELLRGAATLYLIGDARASKLLRPVFLALLAEIVDRAYELATRSGGRLAHPLLLCLDEAGNVAPLPNLAEVASTAPSHNIQLISIFHDLAQARSRYGHQAETVVNSHRARMLLPGVADLDTLRYFGDLLGEEEIRDVSRTTSGLAGPGTRTQSTRRRPLLAAEALRQLPDGHALLLYGRLPPARIRLRMWFDERALRRLAGDPPASPA